MKLTFIGIKPSRPLKQMLLSNGFEVAEHASVPRGFSPKKTDLIAVMAKEEGFTELLKKWREQAPSVWIAAVVTKGWFTSSAKINLLVQCDEKNDVWVKDVWEQMFWFSLQKYFQFRHVATKLSEATHQNKNLRSDYKELNQKSKDLVEKLEKDVTLASNIQRSLLPKVSPEIPGVNIAVKYLPSQGLGGDYYDIFEFGDKKRFGIVLADSKSHGMAATLLSILLKIRIEEVKERFPDSESFLNFVGAEMQMVHKKEMPPMSLLYGILDRSTLQFQFTSAGDIEPVIWRAGSELTFPHVKNPPLGSVDKSHFRQTTVSLKPGDLIVLHTDGLRWPLASEGKTTREGLTDILRSQMHSPDPLEIRNELLALVDKHVDSKPLEDDVTLIQLAIDDRVLYVAKDAKG